MTIRQYLIRRSDRYATLAVAFLLTVGIAAGYAPRILAIRIVFALLVCVILAPRSGACSKFRARFAESRWAASAFGLA
jgi:hypothetical protein